MDNRAGIVDNPSLLWTVVPRRVHDRHPRRGVTGVGSEPFVDDGPSYPPAVPMDFAVDACRVHGRGRVVHRTWEHD